VFQFLTSFSYIQNTTLQKWTNFVIKNNCTGPEYSLFVCLLATFFLSFFELLCLFFKGRVRVLGSGGLYRRIKHDKYCHLILKERKMKPTEDNWRILFLHVVLNADDDIYKHKSLLMHWMCPKYIVRCNLQTS